MQDMEIFSPVWDPKLERYRDDRRLIVEDPKALPDIKLDPGTPAGGSATTTLPQRWKVHSPTGFSWGYGGSGPGDLALNILGLLVPPPEAWRLHHDYKFEIIARLDMNKSHTIKLADVAAWLDARWKSERASDKPIKKEDDDEERS